MVVLELRPAASGFVWPVFRRSWLARCRVAVPAERQSCNFKQTWLSETGRFGARP